MNESNVRRELYRMLRYEYGLWPDHWPDIPGVKEQPGRPDLVVMNPFGPGFYVEVKVVDVSRRKSFPFDAINERQRKWLSLWEEARTHGSWLGLGTVNCPNRAIYLIPWQTWLQIEERVGEYATYLPLVAGKGERKALQEYWLDFSLIEKYALLGNPTAGWHMPAHLEAMWNLQRLVTTPS